METNEQVRSINELLTLLLKKFIAEAKERKGFKPKRGYLEKYSNNARCLCRTAYTFLTNDQKGISEMYIISKYIKDNPPETSERFKDNLGVGGYYWKPYCVKPRIDWLKKHIELTKDLK